MVVPSRSWWTAQVRTSLPERTKECRPRSPAVSSDTGMRSQKCSSISTRAWWTVGCDST